MKAIFIITGVCAAVFLGTFKAHGQQNNKETTDLMPDVRKSVDSGSYLIAVNYAIPASGSAVYLTSGYTLEVKNDSVFSYLPYFGRAYHIPYGGGKGLIFKEAIKSYKAEYRKRGKIHVRFSVRNNEDNYSFYIILFENGSADIHVSSANRQSISFKGNMKLPARGH